MKNKVKDLTLIVCASGRLGMTGLTALRRIPGMRIKAVLTNKDSSSIIAAAKRWGIRTCVGNPRRQGFADTVPTADVLLSVNYLFLLPGSITAKAGKIAINIHDSLLPRYMGRTPNTWVIINDEIETGITVHEITPECDSGPIIYQKKMPITNLDTGGSLLEKMNRRYPAVIKTVLEQIKQDEFVKRPQDLEKRSYCGKREPSDGAIDFRWSARKVYNWVRAQTKPYPGAFYDLPQGRLRVWKAEEINRPRGMEKRPQGVPYGDHGAMVVKCGVGAVALVAYEWESLEHRGKGE